MGFMTCFFSGSADSLDLMRFAAVGEEGSSSALRFGATILISIATRVGSLGRLGRRHEWGVTGTGLITFFFYFGGHRG